MYPHVIDMCTCGISVFAQRSSVARLQCKWLQCKATHICSGHQLQGYNCKWQCSGHQLLRLLNMKARAYPAPHHPLRKAPCTQAAMDAVRCVGKKATHTLWFSHPRHHTLQPARRNCSCVGQTVLVSRDICSMLRRHF